MDQVKIGKFIAECRKEKGLTQRELADILGISDKTVSKWERGNGLPDVSLMLPLCNLLGISVNELLSGICLDQNSYQQKAEENFMSLIKEKQEAKKKIILEIVIGLGTILPAFAMYMLAGLLTLETWIRIVLIASATFLMLVGISVCCVLERDAGVYECSNCGEKFKPSMKAFIFAPHIGFTRKLKCPKCGKKTYCKKRLG